MFPLSSQPRVMKNPNQQTYLVKSSIKLHLFSHRIVEVGKEFTRKTEIQMMDPSQLY